MRLGLEYPATFETPLIDALVIAYYIRLFLDQVFLLSFVFDKSKRE
jgi:hypothetical protein